MHPRRTHAEHVALYDAFATAVAGLSPAAWERIEARCSVLDSPSFAALVRRGQLFATPYALWLPDKAREHAVPRAIAAFSRGVMQAIGVTYELLAEFDADAPPRAEAEARPEPAPTGTPYVDAYVRASSLIESALAARERAHPGVATAVRSAAQAVLRHDWLPPDAFEAAYRYVAPEIPFESLADDETKRLLPPGVAEEP
jgi:hypothetical protein